MNNKKWEIFLSLQGNDRDTPPPSKDIVRPIETTEKILTDNKIFDYFPIQEYKNIIVIGAGDGGEVVSLLNHGYHAIGTTWHHSDKKFAYDNYGIDLIIEDMHDMKTIKTGYYDGIFSYHVLEHSISPIIALFEMKRILRKNGRLLSIVPSPGINEDIGTQHYSVLRSEHWKHLLELIGFKNIQIDIIKDNIIMKAMKGDKDCPGKHFEIEINKLNVDMGMIDMPSQIEENFVYNELIKLCKKDQDNKNDQIKILEFGCGNDNFANRMSDLGYNVTGIDLFERIADSKFSFIRSDFLHANLPQNHFDAVYGLSSFEHIGLEQGELLSEKEAENKILLVVKKIRSILKDDGILLVTVPFGNYRYYYVSQNGWSYQRSIDKDEKTLWGVKVYDLNDIHDIFESNNFTLVKKEFYLRVKKGFIEQDSWILTDPKRCYVKKELTDSIVCLKFKK